MSLLTQLVPLLTTEDETHLVPLLTTEDETLV